MSDTMTITIEHTSTERRLLAYLSQLGMRETACVLGTGAMGEPAWPDIPPDAWLIGVNGAVEIPLPEPLKLNARMVFDTAVPRLGYGAQYAELRDDMLTILGDAMPWPADYRFGTACARGMEPDSLTSICTVGGAALDLCRRCFIELGIPRVVYLCGLDFGGGYYFKRGPDGSRYRCNTPGVWDHKFEMDWLIKDCIARGMRVLSLSKTELDVEYVQT